MNEPTHQQRMVAAILDAITTSCRLPETGEFVVDPAEAVLCLSAAIAISMETDPTIVTSKQMREASERVARAVRHQLKFQREEFERTGVRPWDAEAVPIN